MLVVLCDCYSLFTGSGHTLALLKLERHVPVACHEFDAVLPGRCALCCGPGCCCAALAAVGLSSSTMSDSAERVRPDRVFR